ncbi:MAG: hypothetical protein JF597_44280 [Streptomyces sp.]|uniref:hypothetical protein n=1 Tax=Streptomyces sp. TaxID=1931 RepID=UPI0025F6AE0A|nr:hypothetical protein [Streptomyces sp.]MBW8800344.1 hypothetical protein [Streptomyces sp.]
MVSSPHEAMHRIFQQDPGLFPRAVRALGVSFSDPVSASPFPTDLTETRPLERRVDTLLRLDTAKDGSFLLAVEAQGGQDADKPASWAYYLAYLYAKYKMPAVLLVVCRDRNTASWAARQVSLGPSQWPTLTLRPLVLGPDTVPVIDTPEAAAKDISLAVLSSALHSRAPESDAILKALAAALKGLQADDEDTASIYIELTEQGLGKTPAADLWRHLMAVDLSIFQSQTAQALRAEGLSEGLSEALLVVLSGRGIDVSDEARARITTCDDHDTLTTWLTRAATATTTAELFADTEG